MSLPLSGGALVFKICDWISDDMFRELVKYADYLGRRNGCSIFIVKPHIASSPLLARLAALLDKFGAEMDATTRTALERAIEEATSVYISLSRKGFVLKSRLYLSSYVSEFRAKGVVWYSKQEGGFVVRPHAVIDVVHHLYARGLRVVDQSGLIEFNNEGFVFQGKLRPYQEEAIEAWRSNKYRGLVVLPTGAGKTIVALAAMALLGAKTLIVVYTREQMFEWLDKIKKFVKVQGRIGLFYSERKEIGDVTIATYQSAYRNLDMLWNRFSLLIVDEAHHLPADKFRLIALHVMAPYRLGLTATPYREDGRHEELFGLLGGVVYEKSLAELEGSGYVARFEVIPRLVSLTRQEYEKYRSLKRKYSLFSRGRTVQELVKASAAGDESARKALQTLSEMRKLLALSKSKLEEAKKIIENEKVKGNKIIVFTQYVSQAEELGKLIGAPVLTGRMDKTRRRVILELFKKGRYPVLILTTVGDEGIDIPDANVGVVLSGTSSRRQFIQRLGRLLRPQPGKVARLYYLAVKGTQEEAAMRRVISAL